MKGSAQSLSPRLRLCIVGACASLVAACGGAGAEQESGANEEFTNFTPHVWSAEPGVDLFDRGSELIRAASEAGFYWPAIEEIDDYFPGFTDALSPSERDGFVRTRWGNDRADYLKPVEETMFMHIADYSESPTMIAATVCNYKLFSVEGFNPANPPGGTYRIVLENTGQGKGVAGIADGDPQHGTDEQRTPSWNVFGSWKIKLGKTFFGGTEKSPRDDGYFVPQECRDWWLQQFPGLMQPDPDSPYQQQPPGFVAPVIPVGVQFPGWIGPSNVA